MTLRIDRTLVSIHEARAILDASAVPIERTEVVPLAALPGRVLARSISAVDDVPAFARSAMDGYAVVAADTASATPASPVSLTLIESVHTGSVPGRPVTRGGCTAVATGTPIPDGADAVVMVERTRRDGDRVLIEEAVAAGTNISPRGSDLRAGQEVLQAGTLLTPSRAAVIAAAGLDRAEVFARPRVAVIVTGDEVVPPGRPLRPGQVHDVNSLSLAATVREHGGDPITGGIVKDDPAAIRDALDAALSHDMVLVTGGSSVGERDYLADLLAERGQIRFAGIRLKPGKPTIFAIVDGRPVFGMPGNPTSCLSNGYLLVAPMLRRIARLPALAPRTVAARLAQRVTSPRGRHQFYTVRVEDGVAYPAFKSSGDITSIANADGFFEIEEETGVVEEGATIQVVLF
ncbi:MAG TPA: gephyrin-like molybdotransferase Glp [Vicinamibacterales bacterium]|nr:gephyrin-like molybdotransferase Glp [Vicinamibacterales bacterium]